jgi:hypothetical protein
MKLVYKNQVQLMELFNQFSIAGEMTLLQFDELCEATQLFPVFTSAAIAHRVFREVNVSEVADADSTTLNQEEFIEVTTSCVLAAPMS